MANTTSGTVDLTPAQQRDLERYRSEQVLTAPPRMLIVMLLERAITDLDNAIGADSPAERSGHIRHAQDIVLELRCSLDMAQGEIAENLDSLYAWVEEQCVDGFVQHSDEPLIPAQQVLTDILDGWRSLTP